MKILHIDIEVSPNTAFVWSLWGQNIPINHLVDTSRLMCYAAKWHGKKRIIFDSEQKTKRLALLKNLHKLLSEADVIVTYNGDRFDLPIIKKEFLLHGLPPPDSFKSIDLYKIIKRKFKFPSNKLDHIAQELGVGQKVKHEGFELWVKCMNGDKAAWRRFEKYNRMDTTLLEKVYNKVLPWIDNHPNYALYVETDRPVCTNCGSHHVVKVGIEHTKTQSYQRFRCKDCHTPLRSRSSMIPREKSKNILTQA